MIIIIYNGGTAEQSMIQITIIPQLHLNSYKYCNNIAKLLSAIEKIESSQKFFSENQFRKWSWKNIYDNSSGQ